MTTIGSSLTDFVVRLKPEKTVLLLGAGASVPSGAPTSAELAAYLSAQLAPGEHISDDLAETCSILENRLGRRPLVEAIRTRLRPLRPSGGLLSLPEFAWPCLYTTNFDRLLELAYKDAQSSLVPIRSNFDYYKADGSNGLPLFKIHGCITEDIVDGHNARMVLSERDYEEYDSYREVLYKRLSLDLLANDVLVIGQSLKDPHLRRDMQIAADLHKSRGAPGRLFALVYEGDPDRAQLWQQKGLDIAIADIDAFVHELAQAGATKAFAPPKLDTPGALPPALTGVTWDVSHARLLGSDAVRLFNGSAAAYGDIAAGYTFPRSAEPQILNALKDPATKFATVTGAAGVGKTTLARRVASSLAQDGWLCWEHRTDFPLHADDWLGVNARLVAANKHGVLVVDDCTHFMRQLNALASSLATTPSTSGLHLVLTATTSRWVPRIKARELFAHGMEQRLTSLSPAEIDELLSLLDREAAIRGLVESDFAALPRADQTRRLRGRCSADMYVCLKNIFASDALDTILLREFADLDEDLQDIYRFVAALEATGTRVHRQLVLRLLGSTGSDVAELLQRLEGVVDEYTIAAAQGLFGWGTRHEVVAQTIARYKFADQAELFKLLDGVIAELNPTVWIEMRTLRDICTYDFGIQRLTNLDAQIALYEKLIDLAPGERIPRHRLIRTRLRQQETELAAQAIRDAEANVTDDPLLSRYKVGVALQRSALTAGILDEDRKAMLLEARTLALRGISEFPDDKHAFRVYGDVGEALAERFGFIETLDDAIAKLSEATERILDPDVGRWLAKLERVRRGLVALG